MGIESLYCIMVKQTSSSLKKKTEGKKAEPAFVSLITPGDPSWMLMESLALLLYKNLNITWLSVCKEQMHSLLFHQAYQGHENDQ